MHIEFDIPELPTQPEVFSNYWARVLFIRSPSSRYEINALTSTYVRLVEAAFKEYKDGTERLRDFWLTHSSVNLGAMHRSISHFESCIFDINRAINCFRKLRGDRHNHRVALALRREKFSFAHDLIANRVRDVRNEIHHLEDSILSGIVMQGQNFALRPEGLELPHQTEKNQTVKTLDRLTIGAHELLFSELAQWLTEMGGAVSRIAEALPSHTIQAKEHLQSTDW